MKQISLLIFLLTVVSVNTLFSQNKENIIQDIQVQTDFVENGAKGIRVSITYNYDVLRKKYNSDSLMEHALNTARFSYTLSIFQDSNQVKQAFGYQTVFVKSDFIEIKMRSNPVFLDSKLISESNILFIPYAALKLKEGKQSLSISTDLTGKDGFNATYKQNTRSAVFTFDKPITKIFECSLDSVVVKPFDNNGQAWDHELFGTDAPDLDFSIKMGDVEVGNIHKGNNYFIAFPTKPRVFRFLVSENDEVTISLTDIDDAFHDPIASWRFNTTNMKEGTVYEQKEAKQNMKSFSFKCKVGKIKDQKEVESKK
jgi:hypothetical protein